MFGFKSAIYFVIICCGHVSSYDYVIKTHSVPVDHFSFTTNVTFNMRYLINDTFWEPNSGPVFFYTGNEGNIELFANNTVDGTPILGFMWEIAPNFKALLVFAEHRYYGESLPFGNESFSDPKHLGYLTSQQALADYVDLIAHLTWNYTKPSRNPVIAFGGSYGGMLAAYMRMKYPHVVAGAIASSAPIWQFEGMAPCDVFARIATSDYTAENDSCSKTIRNSWAAINNVTSTEDGLKWLSEEWKLCHPLNASKVENLKDWLTEVYGNLAMLNYPYPTDFLVPLPGHPVREVCRHLLNHKTADKDLLMDIFKGVSVYFNFTGQASCLDFNSTAKSSLGEDVWDFQSCTEMVMPMCQTGTTDMFEPKQWDLTEFSESCEKKWNVTPQPFLAGKIYGGKSITAASNIVFSNGLLDPWTGGGVLRSPGYGIVVILVPEAAHHLDLRASHPSDPASVRRCRKVHKENIRVWIKQHETQHLAYYTRLNDLSPTGNWNY